MENKTIKEKFEDWLKKNKLWYDTFAVRIDVSSDAVYKWFSGKRMPNRKNLIKIETATKGIFKSNHFVKLYNIE
jgi:DNA-binding transcriptional regulator YiaG